LNATSSVPSPSKCTKIVGGAGVYSAPQTPLAGLRGPTSKGEGREGRGGTLDPHVKM